MKNILIAGAGRIGSLLSQLLANTSSYNVILIDQNSDSFKHIPHTQHLLKQSADVSNKKMIIDLINKNKIDAVVACLPYFMNIKIAEIAAETNIHYFDLTEDVETAKRVGVLSRNSKKAYITRCGVAPGFVNIVANDLMKKFSSLDTVKLRAGCLPKHVSNSLQYALAWSIDGLINEYGNTCYGIVEGKYAALRPLEDIEQIELDGVVYEAFNTSGGVGALPELFKNKVKTLNYKTIRYPGHCEKMRFLMQDLHLNEDRETLKKILLRSLPHTDNDVMIVYVSVSGQKNNEFEEENYVLKIQPKEIFSQKWSAIQVATASSAAAIIDIVLLNPQHYSGVIFLENFSLDAVLSNQFGKYLC